MLGFRKLGTLALGALSALSHVANAAYDVSEEKTPEGNLGMGLDYTLATAWPDPSDVTVNNIQRIWAFNTHIVFKDSVEETDDGGISDAKLWQLARDAADEMDHEAERYSINKMRLPGAIAVLAWGNEIIIASSHKGNPSFSYNYNETPVKRDLELCQMVWADTSASGTDKKHRTEAKCAEPMAAQLYYATTSTNLKDSKARVGSWTRKRNDLPWEQTDPCGDPSKVRHSPIRLKTLCLWIHFENSY